MRVLFELMLPLAAGNDARAQFQWQPGNANDPNQREAARRELSRL